MDFDVTPHDAVGDAAGLDGGHHDGGYEPYTVPPVAEFGLEQATAYDWDGDGVNDSLTGFLAGVGSFDATDFDGDGQIDYLAIDTDGDGQYDVLITHNHDTGGFDLQYDSDGDGTLDSTQTLSGAEIQAASPDLWNLINEHYTPLEDHGVPDVWYPEVVDGQVLGDPFAQGEVWFSQSWDGSVVPASVVEIYNAYSETQITSVEFVQVVNEYSTGGWVTGAGGTPGLTPEVVVGVLEAQGVQATTSYASMTVLEQALTTQEYSVMVAYESAGVSQMTTVTSVSYETSMVYLSATAVSGEVVAVPVSVFADSWAASEYTMVECTQSASEYHEAHGYATDSYQAYSETNASSYTSETTVVQQATAGPWVLLPISGTTLALAAG